MNKMLFRNLIALALLAGSLSAVDVEAQFRDLDNAWAKAVSTRDYSALDNIFDNTLIYAHSTGAVESKQQYIDRLKSGAQKYDAIAIEKTRVVPHGDSTVTHSFVRLTGTSNGKPFNDHVMMLHIWVKQGGAWKLAAHQTTKLPN